MVALLLKALGGDARGPGPGRDAAANETPKGRIRCYHIDCRLSESIDEIAQVRWKKLFRLFKYCAQAIGCGLRFGARHFYYVPAPGLRAAVYRDWIVMALCRPFFRRRIFHWHAVGLSDWLEREAKPWERWLTRALLGRPALSLVLANFNRRDAEYFQSGKIVVVPNGIPDPCPSFEEQALPQRRAQGAARARGRAGETARAERAGGDTSRVFRVLYLGLCHREKGLFDAVEAVALANARLAPWRVHLTVAGTFYLQSERAEFEARIRQPDLCAAGPLVEYVGFVSGEEKARLFQDSDCFCLPTYYPAESFGLVLVEAMAYGLPVVTTNWRMIPELLPPGYAGIVPPRAPEQIATALIAMAQQDYDPSLRAHFLKNFTEERFAENIRAALRQLGEV